MQDGSTGAVMTDVAADRAPVITPPPHHRAATAATPDIAVKQIEQRPQ